MPLFWNLLVYHLIATATTLTRIWISMNLFYNTYHLMKSYHCFNCSAREIHIWHLGSYDKLGMKPEISFRRASFPPTQILFHCRKKMKICTHPLQAKKTCLESFHYKMGSKYILHSINQWNRCDCWEAKWTCLCGSSLASCTHLQRFSLQRTIIH